MAYDPPSLRQRQWGEPLNETLDYLDTQTTLALKNAAGAQSSADQALSEIDGFTYSKGRANGLASLDSSGHLVQSVDWGNVLDPPVVTVKDYGAKGDGSTDDTDAIKAALADSPGRDNLILFPGGTYMVSETIRLPSNTNFMSVASPKYGAPKIKAMTGSGLTAVAGFATWYDSSSSGAFGCNVHGIEFDGNDEAQYGLVCTSGANNITYVSCVNTLSHGFYLPDVGMDGSTPMVDTHGARFLYCGTSQNGGDGFHGETKHMDYDIIGISPKRCVNGVYLGRGTGITVTDSHPTKYSGSGIWVEGAWQTRISNNYIDQLGYTTTGDTHYGIYVKGGGPCVVTGNTINSKPGESLSDQVEGIHLESSGSLNVSCTGNTVLQGGTGTAVDGVIMSGTFPAQSAVHDNLLVDSTGSNHKDHDWGTYLHTTDANGLLTVPHTLGVAPSWIQGTPSTYGPDNAAWRCVPNSGTATDLVFQVFDTTGTAVANTGVSIHWEARR